MGSSRGHLSPTSSPFESPRLNPAFPLEPYAFVPGPGVSLYASIARSEIREEREPETTRILFAQEKNGGTIASAPERPKEMSLSFGGDVIALVGPGTGTVTRWLTPTRFFVVYVGATWLRQFMDRPPEGLVAASLRHLTLRDPLLGGLVHQLFLHCIPLSDDRRADAIALAHCLAARVLRARLFDLPASAGVVRRLSAANLARISEIIEARIEDRIYIPSLARAVNLSQSRFNVLFKATTGITCEQYILRARLNRARDLIQSGRYTIGQVAHMTGFSDHSHLTFKFTSWFGAPPKSCLPPVRTG